MTHRRAREYPEGPLFPGRWYKHKMRLDLADKCAKASIAPVTANDLRRTFASWLANRGVPEIVTLRLMGHTSSTMVRRVYAQLSRDTLAAAVDGLPTVANVCQTGASRPGHNGRGGSR